MYSDMMFGNKILAVTPGLPKDKKKFTPYTSRSTEYTLYEAAYEIQRQVHGRWLHVSTGWN